MEISIFTNLSSGGSCGESLLHPTVSSTFLFLRTRLRPLRVLKLLGRVEGSGVGAGEGVRAAAVAGLGLEQNLQKDFV